LLVGQPVAWGQQPKAGGTLTVGLAADIETVAERPGLSSPCTMK
jgi:hypothetical protein